MTISIICYNCGVKNDLPDGPVSRSAECEKCKRDLRVCKNCSWHDVSYSNECRENQADRVKEKESRNTCDYFKGITSRNKLGADKANNEKSAALKKLDDLFK